MEDRARVVERALVCSAAVNERTLLIMAAVGAAIVAYAVYALLSRGMVERPPAPVSVSATPEPPRAAPKAERTDVVPGLRPQANPLRGDPGGTPPAVPMPEVSLEEAREDYDAFIEELERELKRNEETGKALANEHWVEYYRRGHEIMDPLRRFMSTGSDAERKEVGELDERLRTLMSDLQRDPAAQE